MKKSVLFFLILLSVNVVNGQNVNDRDITFEYIRLPLQPLNKSIKNFQSFVELEYEADVLARKEAYLRSVQEAEQRYAQEVANYDKTVKDAGVKYAQDMAVYKVNRLANPNLQEPVLVLPNRPEKFIPEDYNFYPKEVNKNQLAATISLDGYNRNWDNPVFVTALLKGFEYMEPVLRTNEISRTKDGVTTKETQYSYEMQYRHPMGLRVEDPIQGVIFKEYFDDLNRYSVYRTNKFKSQFELEQAFNKSTVINTLQDNIIRDNLSYVNNFMNQRFGISKVRATERLSLIQAKKYSYADYQQAFEAAALGLSQLGNDINRVEGSRHLNAAVAIWENALRDSRPNDKKARINGPVTTATMFNIAIASIYANEFMRAETYLTRIFASDTKKKELRKVEQVRAFLRAQQARFDAYNKI